MDCALVFPPVWYFSSVPADLTYVHAWLVAHGAEVGVWNLSAAYQHDRFGHTRGFRALRSASTYRHLADMRAAHDDLRTNARGIAASYRVRAGFRYLDFGDAATHLPAALEVGLARGRNPALGTLRQASYDIVAATPKVVALAYVHPDQQVQVLAMAALLRRLGFAGTLVIYGSLEDVVAPADWLDDLVGEPRHAVFDLVDAVVVGDSEAALLALCRGETDVPNVVWGADPKVPARHRESLSKWPSLRFDHVVAAHHPYPQPVVDLRLGRGCSWGKCAFCAIQSHQLGYRGGRADHVAESMHRAHEALGTTFFRIRDDLVTPPQLRALARAIAPLPFRPRWMVRGRFVAGFTEDVLAESRAAGLEEMWMGLESGSARVRDLMDKGVDQDEVVRILHAAARVGVRVRALCIAGFPGETDAEFTETLDFLLAHRDRLSFASVTPFQLARNSPMAADPERFGVRVLPDPLPRAERLRHLIPYAHPDGAPGGQRLARAMDRLASWTTHLAGPEPTHDWLHASVGAG